MTATRADALNYIEGTLQDSPGDHDAELILDRLAGKGYSDEAVAEGAVPTDLLYSVAVSALVQRDVFAGMGVADPADAPPAAPSLLLTDGEGWAGLYDSSDATHTRLSKIMQSAELAGDVLFTQAYLVLPSGSVVPAIGTGSRTTFDEDDYASARLTFRPVTFEVGSEADVEFLVSWSVDGRS